MDAVDALVDQLFRREAGRMVSVLVRVFGTRNLTLAEDVVQDVLCRALDVWKFRGMPENPSAWIISAAKNRVIDVLRRERTAEAFSQMFLGEHRGAGTEPDIDVLFQPAAVKDEQLRMMFTCCHPKLGEEAQVALILHILCGFSTVEIAAAFLATPAAAEKRVSRAKKLLAQSKRLLDLNQADVSARLPSVQRALYLLFNEGYHGANPELAIRSELCKEAMYLVGLLLDHPLARTGPTYGLAALMCLNAARLPARVDARGNFVPLASQDRSKWDGALIIQGHDLLGQSALGWELADYQIEAAISAVHARANAVSDTDWTTIVGLYDSLMEVHPSAVVALNRAIAIGWHEGPDRGLAEIDEISGKDQLNNYRFYWAALGEFELRAGRHEAARRHFVKARRLARNPLERAHYGERCVSASKSGPL